jgi:hypothetical protein
MIRNAAEIRSSFDVAAAIDGANMKNVIAAQSLPEECFVLQMDGKAKSQYRRFVDALRAGLQLRDQFPHHDVKVRAIGSER